VRGGSEPTSLLLRLGDAVSYCGLTAGVSIGRRGKEQRGPILQTKETPWLQTVLIEAAKLAHALESAAGPRCMPDNWNWAIPTGLPCKWRRKLVAYLLAVDKSGQPFQVSDSAANSRKRHGKRKEESEPRWPKPLSGKRIPSFSICQRCTSPGSLTFMRDCATELGALYTLCPVSRSAGFASLKSSRPTLTQRFVPANGCLANAAYALVLLEDRGQSATQKLYPPGEHLPPSPRGISGFPFDRNLSWMSPASLRGGQSRPRLFCVGEALSAAHQGSAAAAEFQKILITPTWVPERSHLARWRTWDWPVPTPLGRHRQSEERHTKTS